MRQRNLSSHDP